MVQQTLSGERRGGGLKEREIANKQTCCSCPCSFAANSALMHNARGGVSLSPSVAHFSRKPIHAFQPEEGTCVPACHWTLLLHPSRHCLFRLECVDNRCQSGVCVGWGRGGLVTEHNTRRRASCRPFYLGPLHTPAVIGQCLFLYSTARVIVVPLPFVGSHTGTSIESYQEKKRVPGGEKREERKST